MKRIFSIFLLAICVSPAAARAAQDQPIQNEPRWSVRTLAGVARIHDWDANAGWFEVRVARALRSGLTSIDVGIGGSGSPSPFMSLTSGLEIQPWRQKRLSPFLRGEAGLLGESDFTGVVVGVGGGLLLRISPRVRLRFGAALNSHGRTKGPVTSYGGVEYRW
jgi:hypothetical protein